jgi:hypothetical protein
MEKNQDEMQLNSNEIIEDGYTFKMFNRPKNIYKCVNCSSLIYMESGTKTGHSSKCRNKKSRNIKAIKNQITDDHIQSENFEVSNQREEGIHMIGEEMKESDDEIITLEKIAFARIKKLELNKKKEIDKAKDLLKRICKLNDIKLSYEPKGNRIRYSFKSKKTNKFLRLDLHLGFIFQKVMLIPGLGEDMVKTIKDHIGDGDWGINCRGGSLRLDYNGIKFVIWDQARDEGIEEY